MAILSPQTGVNSFHQALIDQRARLISHESLFDSAANKFKKDIFNDWKKFLKNPQIIGASNWDYPKALAARRLAILRGIGELTNKHISVFQADIIQRSLTVFKSEYYRHASLIDKHFSDIDKKILSSVGKNTRAGAAVAVAFHKIDTGAVKAALADPLTGILKASTINATVIKLNKKAKIAIAKTIANGRGVDDLLKNWQGVVDSTGHNIRTLARTALMSSSQMSTGMLYAQNADIIEFVQWEATFDSRTCVICGSLHGRRYPVKQQPPLPAHLQCRCTTIPIFKDPVYNEKNLVPKKDAWGNVDFVKGDRDFNVWIRKQSSNVQHDFLGSNLKYKSWRNGWVDINELVKPNLSIVKDTELVEILNRPGIPTKTKSVKSIQSIYSKATRAAMRGSAVKKAAKIPVADTSEILEGKRNLSKLKKQREQLKQLDKKLSSKVDRVNINKQLKSVRKDIRKIYTRIIPGTRNDTIKAAKLIVDKKKAQELANKITYKITDLTSKFTKEWSKFYLKQKGYKSSLIVTKNMKKNFGLPIKQHLLTIGVPEKEIDNLINKSIIDAKVNAKWQYQINQKIKKLKALRQIENDAKIINIKSLPSTANDLIDMKKVSGPIGSNPGQWYQADDGKKYFVKILDKDRSDYEVAANLFYKQVGANVADTGVIDLGDGKFGIISKFVDNLEIIPKHKWSDPAFGLLKTQAKQHFVNDAFIGNWDVVGLNYDNLLRDNKQLIWRLDTGGAMKYRARGGIKPNWGIVGNGFADDLKNMKDLVKNPQGYTVFGDITNKEIAEQLKNVINFDMIGYKSILQKSNIGQKAINDIIDVLSSRQKDAKKILFNLDYKLNTIDERLSKLGIEKITKEVELDKGIYNIIHNDDALSQRVYDQINKTKGTSKIVFDYTRSNYSTYNYRQLQYENVFRKRKPYLTDKDKNNLARVKKLNKALDNVENYKTKEGEFLWRGISANKEELENVMENFLGGLGEPYKGNGIYTMDSITGVTTNAAIAARFEAGNGVIFKIINSKKAKPIASLSSFPSEDELLYQLGTKFKVIKIYQNARIKTINSRGNFLIIEMEEIAT